MSYIYNAWDGETILSLLITLLTGVPTGIFGIGCYALRSMALYTMAQRREIRNAWLSWVPVLSFWILGSLSDQYRYVVHGQIKSKRKWLLWLNLASFVLSTAVLFYAARGLFDVLRYGEFAKSTLNSLLGMLGLAVPLSAVSVALVVIRFMALYDVYRSQEPENVVLFLVLSIFFQVVEPFFLFFNRNKDKGMPPRRDTVNTPPIWEPENKDYL